MPRTKHVPLRTCVGCRAQRSKRELVRVVRSPAGEVAIDLGGKAAGRGAYVCAVALCVGRARKARSLSRSLKCEIAEAFWNDLEDFVKAAGGVEALPMDAD